MSQPPAPRRRRIAGERRRPDSPLAAPGSATPTAPIEPRQTEAAPTSTPVVSATSAERAEESTTFGAGGFAALFCAVVLLATALVLGLFVWGKEVRDAEATESEQRSAVSVAERAAPAILAYDYRTMEANLESALSFMVPGSELAKDIERSYESVITDNAIEQKAVVTAKVLAAGPVSGSSGRVEVLLFVDQQTSKADQQPSVALNRVTFTMRERAGRWLVESITPY